MTEETYVYGKEEQEMMDDIIKDLSHEIWRWI